MEYLNPHKGAVVIREGLYLPREKVRESAIRSSLTFFYSNQQKPLILYKILPNHILVPRNFLPLSSFKRYINMIPEFREVSDFEDRIVLRDEIQEEAFNTLMSVKGGVLRLPCGYGKTVVALKMIANKRLPALVIVHTTDLLNQWRKEIKDKLGVKAGIIQGSRVEWKRPIAVGMLHTLAKHRDEIPEEMRAWFGVVVWDEVDVIGTPKYSRTADIFYGQRFGLSATQRRDGLDLVYYYHIGPPVYKHEGKRTYQPEVYIVDNYTFYPGFDESDPTDLKVYAPIFTQLSKCPKRRELIISLLRKLLIERDKILVLGERKEELRYYHEVFGEVSGLCVQDVPVGQRREFLESKRIIFGIRSLAKRGLDQPDLDTLVILYPMSDPGGIKQSIGRIMRICEEKKNPQVYLIRDVQVLPMRTLSGKFIRKIKEMGFAPLKFDIV